MGECRVHAQVLMLHTALLYTIFGAESQSAAFVASHFRRSPTSGTCFHEARRLREMEPFSVSWTVKRVMICFWYHDVGR